MLLTTLFSSAAFLFLQFVSISCQATPNDLDASSKSIAKLTLDLGKCFQGEKSTFYSAMSLSSAMAMLYLGAAGNTANQISTAFQYSTFSVKDVQKFYADIYQAGTENNCTLDLVNRLYGQTGFSIIQAYLDLLSNYFLAPLQLLDFKSDPTGSAKTINNFVNNVTRGLIPKLFDDNAFVNTEPKFIIMNAIYFRGFWLYKFNTSLTTNETFTVNCNQQVTTQFMNQVASYKYARLENLKSSAIQLDYEGCDVSMTIILPNDTCNGITNLLNKITVNDLVSLTKNSTYRTIKIDLKIPKFELETKYEDELAVCLKNLGVIDVFDVTKSDLSGITKAPLAVDQIIQKAVISVDEEGTKAAVVTSICTGICTTSVELPTKFHATRPFYFFISDWRSNAILFSGTYIKPSS